MPPARPRPPPGPVGRLYLHSSPLLLLQTHFKCRLLRGVCQDPPASSPARSYAGVLSRMALCCFTWTP